MTSPLLPAAALLLLPGASLAQADLPSTSEIRAILEATQEALTAPDPVPGATPEAAPDPAPAPADPAPADPLPADPAPAEPEPAAPEAGEDTTAQQPLPTLEEIEAARYEGGPLPDGRSALTVKVQVLLDRAGISPGVVDGWRGGMSESALAAFERSRDLPVDGILDAAVWQALGGDAADPIMMRYTLRDVDFEDLNPDLPSDYADLAALSSIPHRRITERVAEAFHMDEDFLIAMNPGVSFASGDTIWVASTGGAVATPVTRITVDKSTSRLSAYDASGVLVVDYPVTIGSPDTPSPSGTVTVTAVAPLPTYHYNPDNFVQGENMSALTLPPGPNGPVGSMWIDLSEPSYGLHGTPEPDSLFSRQSHGCVRLTNWDVEELSRLVSEGTVVEFQG
ncbi:L,D-transpeptidase family protein [Wenxinia saemankumensis]|uniref:Lipoprotein-anchoring transpeptidase ErfK/SrfK n=1 Tax=Wenxinia saemankumensis TaxID=1447782 RepID=A0A1M6GRB7_9RHOB|nr:L,D-transpeptidase family protein [Wenxinia saemankumensis]SHJ12483.1 Lipoprotein-anchoring transpeptidase ErfK/SrfK [Wenxinia saemankumensis]